MSSNNPFGYSSSAPHALENGLLTPFDGLFLQTILDRVKDICFVVSPDGEQFFYLNNSTFEQLGYSREELFCLSVKAVVTPTSLNTICDEIHQTMDLQTLSECGCIECGPWGVELIKKDHSIISGTVSCTLQMNAVHTVMLIGGMVTLQETPEGTSEKSDENADVPAGASSTEVSTKTDSTAGVTPIKNSFPGKILIMDDEEILIDIALQMGKRIGLIVETAENGEKAVKMYREAMLAGYPYDAVLLDMTISGGMGGIEASKELHAIDKNVVAIVMSGYSDHEVMAKPNDYGFSGVISKPFRLNEFSKVLHEQIPEEKFRNGDSVS